jgi:pimeloyl-ACP methyl ester carboxylesterase
MPAFHSFDGVRLHYDDEGSGPPVVLLHGFAASTELNWRAPGILGALVDAGHRVVGLDARGHGESEKRHDPAAYADDAMVRDVAALLDHLGLAETDVAGYSMGAATALRFALADLRIRRLVLGGTNGGLGEPAAGLAERRRHLAAALDADDPGVVTDELAMRFRRFAESTGADLHALAALQRGRNTPPPTRAEVASISVPTLVVCGDRDVSPHELAGVLAAGRAAVVAGDHLSAVRDPAFAAEIVGFLS